MGTPSKEQWPSIVNLPDFTIHFPKWKKQSLEGIIKNIPALALDLL